MDGKRHATSALLAHLYLVALMGRKKMFLCPARSGDDRLKLVPAVLHADWVYNIVASAGKRSFQSEYPAQKTREAEKLVWEAELF